MLFEAVLSRTMLVRTILVGTMPFLRACFVVAGVALCSIFGFAGEQQWVEVRSPNFSVITDAGEKKGRDVALHFEQMRSVFGTLMTKANVNLAVPLQIVAFRNSKELRPMAPLFKGKPTEVAGLFQGGQDRSFIMLDMSVEDPWTVVFHEYAHQLMNGNLSFETSPWFEEGFAEYYSSIEVDNKEARVGKIPNDTYLILQQMGMMKTSDLLRVQQNTSTYNESGDHRNTFYAESSLLVHYLYDNHLIPKLSVYFDNLQGQKKTVEQSLQASLGMTPDQLDKALRQYLTVGRYRYYPIATPPAIVAAQFAVAPVSGPDARALMADIHAHSPDYKDKALGEFQEVLKTDPDNEAALRGVGFAYLQQTDYPHAAEYLRRAVQHNSKDPRVHCYYAMLLNQEGSPDAERRTEIKKELETAIALDPNLADAYSLLGYTQAFSGEGDKAIVSLRKALELSPRNENYLFNLANAYMVNQKIDNAIAIFRSLAENGNPTVSIQARQSLEQALNFKSRTGANLAGANQPNLGSAIVEVRDEVTGEWRREKADQPAGAATEAKADEGGKAASGEEQVVDLPPGAPMRFLKGRLVSIDCSAAPQAVVTVNSGTRTMKVHIQDSAHVLLIGADKFSCDWKNVRVAVNYRERPDGDGEAVSLEMQ
jgi:cytochrome c-type biogenesis protein CcmH/NrfG